MSLADKSCAPCRGGVPALDADTAGAHLSQLEPGWEIDDAGHLRRKYLFPDFARALAFANQVGAIAEAEWHHPDLHVAWGKVEVEIWSHKIDGLSEADFVLAAKADRVYGEEETSS